VIVRVCIFLATLAAAAAGDTLAGRVLEDHTANPLASVEVRVYRAGVRQLAAHLETDLAGRFTALNLPAGDYRLEFAKPNYISASLRLPGVSAGLLIRLVRARPFT
jgi:5-hydroxyisourate hydrolase-like protein (transthyretin family)